MRKVNFIFAAVFSVALLLGGINVYTAVDAADKKGAINTVNDSGSLRRFDVIASVARQSGMLANKNSTDTVNQKNINAVRKGRKIQVDGFLLEWRGADANVWPGSDWRWDAVGTADGVAGYVSLPAGVGSDWVLTLQAANTGRALRINLPGQPAGEFFAFDKVAFDAGGPLTAEWIVPWDFFDDDGESDVYELSINAVSAEAGALRPLVLTIEAPEEPRAPGRLSTRLTMVALIAALTILLVVNRRRQMREKRLI